MRLRLLTPAELPLVLPLMQELTDYHNRVAETFAGCYPVRPREDQMRELAEEIEKDRGRVEVAEEDGEWAGFSAGTWDKEYGSIDFLFVRESRRGKGFGGALLTSLLGCFKEKGVTFVNLGVVRGNPAAAFYERYGFRFRSRIYSMHIGEDSLQP